MNKEPFKNNYYYFAYAYHRWPDEGDIINMPFATFEQALKSAHDMLCDDDAIQIYYRENNQWKLLYPIPVFPFPSN